MTGIKVEEGKVFKARNGLYAVAVIELQEGLRKGDFIVNYSNGFDLLVRPDGTAEAEFTDYDLIHEVKYQPPTRLNTYEFRSITFNTSIAGNLT